MLLTNDPATWIAQRVDAGYDKATIIMKEKEVKVPMMD